MGVEEGLTVLFEVALFLYYVVDIISEFKEISELDSWILKERLKVDIGAKYLGSVIFLAFSKTYHFSRF
jgi:hypothetical protein